MNDQKRDELKKRLMERLDKTEEELMYLTENYPNMLMNLSDEALRQVSVPLLKAIKKIDDDTDGVLLGIKKMRLR